MIRLLLALVVVIVLAAVLLGILRAIAATRMRRGRARARVRMRPELRRAWDEAVAIAGAGDHRVARARESCERLLAAAAARPFDPHLRDCAALIEQIVPELVAIGGAAAADAPSPRQSSRIEEMVDLLDQLGDEADRVRSRDAAEAASPFAAHRAYLAARRRDAGD